MRHVAVIIGCVAVVGAAPAMADLEVIAARYVCERGVAVAVTYVNGDNDSVAILEVEGRQAQLRQAVAASGARYAPGPGSMGYEWWSKGDAGTLSWDMGDGTNPTVIYGNCVVE